MQFFFIAKSLFAMTLKMWIISILVEKEIGLISEKVIFSITSPKKENSLWPRDPLPGQKSIRLAKKSGGLSFLNAGFRRFSPAIPLPPRLFAETKRGDFEGFSRPFLASAPAFLPEQQENRSERLIKLEMIQKCFSADFRIFPDQSTQRSETKILYGFCCYAMRSSLCTLQSSSPSGN